MNKAFSEYLGPDGRKITASRQIYLQKCQAFVTKARKLKTEKARKKRSIIQAEVLGYEMCQEVEEKCLNERDKQLKTYQEEFDVLRFEGDKNAMYENYTAKTKQIRIIRELSEPVCFDLDYPSPVVDQWFLRFCMLSRFIQAARIVVLKLRMEKRLKILKKLTPEIIHMLEGQPQVVEEIEEVKPCEEIYPLCPAMCRT